MDRHRLKDAIGSCLQQPRLVYGAFAILFLLVLVASCWPSALAKLPFTLSTQHELKGVWQNEDWSIGFYGSYIRIKSKDYCWKDRSVGNIVVTDQRITFKDSAAQQSYKIVSSFGAGSTLFIDGPGPVPSGVYSYLGDDVFIGYRGDTFVSMCSLTP
jgi:hypothetical protein